MNYQTSYQPFLKKFPDNMPKARRTLHIRTSPDGLHWTPGESFGADGPYLPDGQLITPDAGDSQETEFYHFSTIDLDEFRAGIMVKYVSQPKIVPDAPGMPHGPYLDYEWWVSPDGLTWERPFRDTSGLSSMPRPFAYDLAQPLKRGNEVRWLVGQDIYALDRRRMFYAYSRANAEVVTPLLTLSDNPLELNLGFDAIRRQEEPALRQGYLMAELLDEAGQVRNGFERDKCLLLPQEPNQLALKWADQLLPEPGSRVSLRLCFRDVRLYSVSY